jgi:hypothetical protein
MLIAALFVVAILFACARSSLARQEHDRKQKHEDLVMLSEVERLHFYYFLHNANPDTGLILDRATDTSPASVAAVGFALTAYPVAVERSWIKRDAAAAWAYKVLTTLSNAPMGPQKEGVVGYHGFFYHMLDPKTGLRATAPKFWDSELSSIDTALLIAGVLFARNYFSRDNEVERQIRAMAQKLYDGVEWNWMANAEGLVHLGWTPEAGMMAGSYKGYSEALLMYILALGSKTHPLPDRAWSAFIGDAPLTSQFGVSYVICPDSPLFTYQYPHCWIDFRGLQDELMRQYKLDWFENSRRATIAQYRYCRANPKNFRGYSATMWGLTACDGPGDVEKLVPATSHRMRWRVAAARGEEHSANQPRSEKLIGDVKQHFWGYMARGCPSGPDDGTIAPTAALSSLPFTPELTMPMLRRLWKDRRDILRFNGFPDAFNPTFEPTKPPYGWIDPTTVAIDQGPILLMTENYRTGFVWEVMKQDGNLIHGLQRAGFTGGWL